jgi:DNA polymerase-3 subunit alpha
VKAGAACSSIHGLTYSLIAAQAAYLATYYPSVYWNTAYLRTICGLEEDETANYKKMARGVGNILSWGIEVSPIDVNKSGTEFEPDEENGTIRFGLKALSGLNSEMVEGILANRPYDGFADFVMKNPAVNKTAMVSLIKSGAFDAFEDRVSVMVQYLTTTCGTKAKVSLQNFQQLIDRGIVPKELDRERRVFNYNKSLKTKCRDGDAYVFDGRHLAFFEKNFDIDELEVVGGVPAISQKRWKKLYDKAMVPAKEYLVEHQAEVLDALNLSLLDEEWAKYATGTVSTWEMDSMGYYCHEHELANLRYDIYNISSFSSLPEEPVVESVYRNVPIHRLTRIAGTVIAKDDLKSMFTILTSDSGVVDVKMKRGDYARVNKQVSQVMPDGTKVVLDKPWLARGTKVVVCGMRRGDTFVAKRYRATQSSLFYKITEVNDNGTVYMTDLRADEVEEA